MKPGKERQKRTKGNKRKGKKKEKGKAVVTFLLGVFVVLRLMKCITA